MENAQPEAPAQRIVAGLAKLSLVLRHQAWTRGTQSGLTPTQAQILALLAGRTPAGLSVGQIAAELAVSQPTISDAVGVLKRKGFVRGTRKEADARVVLVRLTPRGARVATRQVEWPDAMRQAVGGLEAAEQASLLQLLLKMIHSLQEGGQIPVARMCSSCVYFRPHVHADSARPHHCDFVDAPLGGGDLRLDCNDHEVLPAPDRQRVWSLFVGVRPPGGEVPSAPS